MYNFFINTLLTHVMVKTNTDAPLNQHVVIIIIKSDISVRPCRQRKCIIKNDKC